MNHEKTFAAIQKLQEVEIEMHRLKNALEMANRALNAPRVWVGLTDEEIDVAYIGCKHGSVNEFAKAIEAKLKEKNT